MSVWDKDAPRTFFAIVQGTSRTRTFTEPLTQAQLDFLAYLSPSSRVRVETWEGGKVCHAYMYTRSE